MKSAIAISQELDDPVAAASDLAEQIRKSLQPAPGQGIGLLFCDADVDGAAVTGELKELLGIDIAGMTTLAEISPQGRLEMSIVLTVLVREGTAFAAVATGSLADGQSADRIRATYRKVAPEGAGKGLVISLCPCGMDFSGDSYADILGEVRPGVPLIGGMASDDFDFERARVFLSGHEYKDEMVAVGIFGGIDPVFALRHVTSRVADRVRRVSKASGNVVHTVGDESFVKYLEGFGLDTSTSEPLMSFTAFPLLLTRPESNEVPIMRHICGLNHEDGSGSFIGNVPEGALANICMVSVQNLTDSCTESMNALVEKVTSEVEYSAILCFSCCGRALVLGDKRNAEGDIISEMLPAGMTVAGAYCLGELCPTSVEVGNVANRFHNCSIAFCML